MYQLKEGLFCFEETRTFHDMKSIGIEDSHEEVHMQRLTAVLQRVDMDSMHILGCQGMTYYRGSESVFLYYEIACAAPPDWRWTLQSYLSNRHMKSARPPLNARVRYAVELVTAVMFTHAAGLVHKSICPRNIFCKRRAEL